MRVCQDARCSDRTCSLALRVQDNEIVKVSSPRDHPVTRGNLCIMGHFGYQHVHNRD